jgi:hypothetical protein
MQNTLKYDMFYTTHLYPYSIFADMGLKLTNWSSTRDSLHLALVQMFDEVNLTKSEKGATVNQHPPVHHQGCMICDQETAFCWVPVP